MTSPRPPNPFSADRPIRLKSEDLLGRSKFAESLAEVVEGWTGNDSLVIALYGPWGIGKSSIKNMMLEHLRQPGESTPTVVEFNPWQLAAQDQLASAFFREVAHALGKQEDHDSKRRAEKVTAYASYLKLGAHVISGFRPLLAWTVGILGALGFGGMFVKAAWLKSFLPIFWAAVVIFAAFIGWSADFAEKAAAALSARQKSNEKTLQERKTELAKLLRGLKVPLLIVIDDIDRLNADEVRLVFQLIKANADFPNLVYLTLFQRDVVEANLEGQTSGTGKDFLEKIVQVGFDVPQVERSKLQAVLFARLDEMLADPKVSKNFKEYRWGNLFPTGLAPYFATLRDVYRFLNVLEVQIARMAPRGTFEVNPIDLIVLEILRVFEPSVYGLLPRKKSILTKFSSSLFRTPPTDGDKEYKLRRNPLVAAAENKEAVKEILEDLFPDISPGNEAVYFRELRVCHPDVFDRYFLLTIPDGDLSQAEIDDLLASTGNREQLISQFALLKKRDLQEVALDRLEAYKGEVDAIHAVPFVSALFDFGDDLPEPKMGTLSLGSWMIAPTQSKCWLKNVTISSCELTQVCAQRISVIEDGLGSGQDTA